MIEKIKSSTAFKGFARRTETVRSFLKKCLRDWSLSFAAMLAFNLLITLIPIAVALVGIFGLVLKNYPDAEKTVKDKFINGFSAHNSTQGVVRQTVGLALDQLSKEAGGLLVIGIILSMLGASRLFTAIDKCMTIIYRLPERPFLRKHFLAFLMVFFFVILIPLLFILSSAPSVLMNVVSSSVGRFGLFIAGILSSLFVAFVFFEAIYWIIPNKKMSFKVTWCGALVAACTLEVFIILFPLYVRKDMDTYTAQIGFAIIFIVFLYYFAIIMILGAQINAFFIDNYQPLEHGLGTCISQIHEEHGVGDPRRSLLKEDADTPLY